MQIICVMQCSSGQMSYAMLLRTRQAPLNSFILCTNCCVWSRLLQRLFKEVCLLRFIFFILRLFPFNGELSPPVAVFWSTAYPKRSKFWCSHFWITLSSQSRCISPSLLLSSHLIWDLLLILSDFKILTIDAGKSLLPNILHLFLS